MEPDGVAKGQSDTPKAKPTATAEDTLPGIITRALAVWLVLICEKILHGIGSELVRRGLEVCRAQGHAIVIVLGQGGNFNPGSAF